MLAAPMGRVSGWREIGSERESSGRYSEDGGDLTGVKVDPAHAVHGTCRWGFLFDLGGGVQQRIPARQHSKMPPPLARSRHAAPEDARTGALRSTPSHGLGNEIAGWLWCYREAEKEQEEVIPLSGSPASTSRPAGEQSPIFSGHESFLCG